MQYLSAKNNLVLCILCIQYVASILSTRTDMQSVRMCKCVFVGGKKGICEKCIFSKNDSVPDLLYFLNSLFHVQKLFHLRFAVQDLQTGAGGVLKGSVSNYSPCPRKAGTWTNTHKLVFFPFQGVFENSRSCNLEYLWTAVEIQDGVQNYQAAIREQRR